MSKKRAISPQVAAKLREVLSAPTRQPAPTTRQPAPPDVQVVRRGDEIDDDPIPYYEGWLRGVPGLDPGDREDLGEEAVVLADLNELGLAEDAEYIAIRGGVTDDGVPIYWVNTSSVPSHEQAVLDDGGLTTGDWEDMSGSDDSKLITLPAAGTYLLFCRVSGEIQGTATSAGARVGIAARLFDETAAAAVPDSEFTICVAQAWNTTTTLWVQDGRGWCVLYTVAEPSVLRLEAQGANTGSSPSFTYALQRVTHSGTHTTRIGYLKVS